MDGQKKFMEKLNVIFQGQIIRQPKMVFSII